MRPFGGRGECSTSAVGPRRWQGAAGYPLAGARSPRHPAGPDPAPREQPRASRVCLCQILRPSGQTLLLTLRARPRRRGYVPRCSPARDGVLPNLDGRSIVAPTGGGTHPWSPFSCTPQARIRQRRASRASEASPFAREPGPVRRSLGSLTSRRRAPKDPRTDSRSPSRWLCGSRRQRQPSKLRSPEGLQAGNNVRGVGR